LSESPADERLGLTAWIDRDTPLRRFLLTESGSALVLLAAAVTALVWVNIDAASYQGVWHRRLSVSLGGAGVAMDLRSWVNSGLMCFFFFVVGLEARREFDLGEFRDRQRLILPVVAGIGGMVGAIGIYLAFNTGRPSIHGWGVAMSTDTAFALGALALLGQGIPDRLRGYILTVSVVDDIVGLVVIATAYTNHVNVVPIVVALVAFALFAIGVRLRLPYGLFYLSLAAVAWVALVKSGVDPLVVGLTAGLLAYAAPTARDDLARVTDLFRDYREQPSPALASRARIGFRRAVSPNARLQLLYHPWTSYVIVPLFGLANAGIPISANFLAHAYTSPITLGIAVGYVVGKPAGIAGMSAVVTTATGGRLRPPVGWVAVSSAGALAGLGFTVALLIASIAFHGESLREATLGVLTAALVAPLLSWSLFLLATRLPDPLRDRVLLGRSAVIIDLVDPIDPERDHVRGPEDAPVTLVEYGDFECTYCGQAEPAIRELLAEHGDLRYVWRHLPLGDVHPHAQIAAEASEAAGAQERFWEMHDQLLSHHGGLEVRDLVTYATALGLDVDRFTDELRENTWTERVAVDVEGADLSGVAGTPSFFVNGQRQRAPYDLDSLEQAVRAAHARAVADPPARRRSRRESRS
jgi:Na+/H+ antiporter NhaA